MSQVYIFTGPSLTPDEARSILPDAVYLPPVTQGDVYRAALHHPQVIGIIDGYFEHVPSVWHKEILWAMQEGIHVLGAASMGALRAAELDAFGMVGIGWIYEAYRTNHIEDDDEVAVAHTDASEGYKALSTALVDIRQTLSRAVAEGVVSAATQAALLDIAKGVFYPKRLYPTVLTMAQAQGIASQELEALRQWLPANTVHQKRLDALAMVQHIRDHLTAKPDPKQVTYKFEHTDMWDTAAREAGVLSLEHQQAVFIDALLEELRIGGMAQYQKQRQAALSRFLGLIEARWQGVVVSADYLQSTEAQFRAKYQLHDEAQLTAWLQANHLSSADFQRLMEDEARLRWVYTVAQPDIEQHLSDQLRSTNHYAELVSRARDKQQRLVVFGLDNPAFDEVGITEDALLHWYFVEQLGQAIPNKLAEYARQLGFEHEHAFKRSVLREYCYQRGQA
ncbi:MAG: hypothetical protein H6673_11480 [Anaerolineales bacterium]|nr:hypothetical protein [Anaerolineales bacterium]